MREEGGVTLRLLVTFEVFDTLIREEDVSRARQAYAAQLQKTLASGKVLASGSFADARGGFFLVDVDAAEDLHELLGHVIIDNCHVETHPVAPFEKVFEMFKKMAAG